jgi:putative glutathione S-transferase
MQMQGVYRAGFAQSQAAYDQAVGDVYDALDKAEDILSKQRYLTGSRFTLADIRLFVTLLRFDEVYVVYFKVGSNRIV